MREITIKVKDKGPRVFNRELARHLRILADAAEQDMLVPGEFPLEYYEGKLYVNGKVTIK